MTSVACTDTDITYSAEISPASAGLFTFDPDTKTLILVTSSSAYFGVYTVKFTGVITTSSGVITASTAPFTVKVVAGCINSPENPILVEIDDANCPLGTYTYAVNSVAKDIPFNPFSTNSLYCDESDITYSISVTPTPPGGLFDLDEANHLVSVYSSSTMLTDTIYTVSIHG